MPNMRPRSTILLVTLVATTSVAGCVPTTYFFEPKTLGKLDGFRAGQEVPLQSRSDDTISFDKNTQLIWRNTGKAEMRSTFQSIEIAGPAFTGFNAKEQRVVQIDLAHLDYAKVQQVATGDKVAGGIIIGIAVVAGVVATGVYFNQGP